VELNLCIHTRSRDHHYKELTDLLSFFYCLIVCMFSSGTQHIKLANRHFF